MFGLTRRRRRKLRAKPIPPDWDGTLRRLVPLYSRLSPADRAELCAHTQVLLAEKSFEGAGGLAVSEEMRVAVAAWGALLLLHRGTDYYPRLLSVVIYPHAFMVPRRHYGPDGTVSEGEDQVVGESWREGTLILSWEEVLADAQAPDDGFNVALHEFAHQLDAEDGALNGTPLLPREADHDWPRVMQAEYSRLARREALRRRTLLDSYALESPAEFFAVATETFFEMPRELVAEQPELYRMLALYYRQDPATWAG